MQTNTPNVFLEWQAPSKVRHERSKSWYVVAGVSCATIIVYGILSGAWSMSLVFGLLAGLFFLAHRQDQLMHTISLQDTGVVFDGKLTTWAECKQFWVLRAETYHELHIEMKRYLSPDIVIQTADVDPYAICETISQYVLQIDHRKEKILDAIIRFCKL